MSSLPLSQTQARRLHALHNRRQREEQGLFLAEGIRVVEELITSPVVIESVIVAPSLEDTRRGSELRGRIPTGVPVYGTSEAGLRHLAETETPQGIVAVGRVPRAGLPVAVADGALVVALDGVQDPGNVGTLVRGADAFGVAALVALPGTADFWSGKTIRSAAGSCFRVPLVQSTIPELREWAERMEVVVWGSGAGGTDVVGMVRPERLLLLLGNEGAGLGAEAGALARARVAVPIRGGAESLNVAMAGTVLMYLLTGVVDAASRLVRGPDGGPVGRRAWLFPQRVRLPLAGRAVGGASWFPLWWLR